MRPAGGEFPQEVFHFAMVLIYTGCRPSSLKTDSVRLKKPLGIASHVGLADYLVLTILRRGNLCEIFDLTAVYPAVAS